MTLSQHSAPSTPWSSLMVLSRFFPSSMVFARKSVARLSISLYSRLADNATEFTLCYGLLFCPISHGGISRFSTHGHPHALGTCYEAFWQLPQPNFHWQADNSFQNTRLSPSRTCGMPRSQKAVT